MSPSSASVVDSSAVPLLRVKFNIRFCDVCTNITKQKTVMMATPSLYKQNAFHLALVNARKFYFINRI